MPERTYFLDASALVYKYAQLKDPDSKRVRARLADLFAARAGAAKRADLQIPSICMAECAKTFARFCFEEKAYGDGDDATDAFRSLREALLKDVAEERIINSYELKRTHFVDIEEIFLRDYRLGVPRGGGQYLSSHDALIISMAREFAERHRDGLGGVVIVTCDRRIAEFCRRYSDEYPLAACLLDGAVAR